MIHLQQRLLVLYWILCGTGISQWKDWNRGVTWSVLRKKISSVRGEQHSSACDEGYGLRKQTDRKGVNCGSRGVTEWVMWPVSLFLLSLTWFSPAPTPPPPHPRTLLSTLCFQPPIVRGNASLYWKPFANRIQTVLARLWERPSVSFKGMTEWNWKKVPRHFGLQ